MPYSFTMNWKITRPNHPIGFEKGEPFCFLFPVKRGLVEQVEPALRDLDEDAESKRQFKYAGRLRKFLSDVKQIKKDATPDPKPSEPSGSSAGTCRGPCLTVPAPSRAIRRAWRSSRSRTCGIARPERSPKGSSLHPVVDLPYLQPLLRAHHYVSA